MQRNSPDLKELKAIVDWVGVTQDVREFSLKLGDMEFYVSRNQHAGSPFAQPAVPVAPVAPVAAPAPALTAPPAATPIAQPALAASPAAGAKAGTELAADEIVIKAPMVGTFYSKPKPGVADFVSPGDRVTTGTVLCIVEVMKLMNNIEASVDGTVVRILVENEQAVEYGQPLMVIKRSA